MSVSRAFSLLDDNRCTAVRAVEGREPVSLVAEEPQNVAISVVRVVRPALPATDELYAAPAVGTHGARKEQSQDGPPNPRFDAAKPQGRENESSPVEVNGGQE